MYSLHHHHRQQDKTKEKEKEKEETTQTDKRGVQISRRERGVQTLMVMSLTEHS
jgi:hypothetical protein